MLPVCLGSPIFEEVLGRVGSGVDLGDYLDGLFLDLSFQRLGLSEGIDERGFDGFEVDLGG